MKITRMVHGLRIDSEAIFIVWITLAMKNVLTEGQCCSNEEETRETEDAKDGCQFSIPGAEDHCLLTAF